MAAALAMRAIGEQPGAGRSHAVIDALISELPAPGTPWPLAERTAWLKLMGTAFTLAYGAAPAPARAPAAAEATTKPKPPKPPKRARVAAADAGFHIDRDGYARGLDGERVLPDDVAGPLVDLRGESGDLGAITWADDTRGVAGLQLNIVLAPVG